MKKGVLYIKHIPHGFYEDEMRKYFSQFGKVTNVRLSRSGKTGRSRGYGFVEFKSEDVAKIAAETMDGYLFFNKILKCGVIPRDKIQHDLFAGLSYPFPLRREIVRIVNNRKRTLDDDKRSTQRRLSRLQKTKSRLKKMGLQYDFTPGVPEELMEPLAPKKKAGQANNESEEDCDLTMLVDPTDTEITLRTPPGAKKVVLRKQHTPSLIDITPGSQGSSGRTRARHLKSGKKSPSLKKLNTTASAEKDKRRKTSGKGMQKPFNLPSAGASPKVSPTVKKSRTPQPTPPSKQKMQTRAR